MDNRDLLFLVMALLCFMVISTVSSLWLIAAYVPSVRTWLARVWSFLIKR